MSEQGATDLNSTAIVERQGAAAATDSVRAGVTREAAIAAARQQYQMLLERAIAITPESEHEYVTSLAAAWDRRLGELRVPARLDNLLPAHVQRRVEFLVGAVADADDQDTVLRWLDAFPEAIADLLPPSRSTFFVIDQPTPIASIDKIRTLVVA